MVIDKKAKKIVTNESRYSSIGIEPSQHLRDMVDWQGNSFGAPQLIRGTAVPARYKKEAEYRPEAESLVASPTLSTARFYLSCISN